MPDYQQIVDQIRSFLGATDQTKTPDLADLASSYVSLCREANERLRRCTDYLRRGLRSEAIQLADAQPALLDFVGCLDFPEIPDWQNACATYDLARPVKLLIEAAQEVNEAYAAEQPLRVLLAQHRRLALAKAPLDERLQVMRALDGQDPENEFWDQDIRTFEDVRLKELTAEANTAGKNKDRTRIDELLAEVTTGDWRVAPPAYLLDGLRRASEALRHRDAEEVIERLIPTLDGAYSAMDYDGCIAALANIDRTAGDAGLIVPDSLSAQIQPVREWVAQEAQRRKQQHLFDESCAALADALDRGDPTETLESMRCEVLAFGFDPPENLFSRLKRELSHRAQIKRRRKQIKFGIAAAAVLLVFALTVLAIRMALIRSEAREYVTNIDRLLQNEQVDDAQKAWDDMVKAAPHIAARDEMVELKTILDRMVNEKRERRLNFERHLQEAMASGPGNPNLEELELARRLSVTPNEKARVRDAEKKIDDDKRKTQDQRDEEFRQKLAVVTEQVGELDTRWRNGQLGWDGADLVPAEKAARTLADSKAVSESLRACVNPLEAKLAAIRDGLRQDLRHREAIGKVRNATNTPAQLKAALDYYVTNFPNSGRSRPFAAAAANAALWESFDEFDKTSWGWANQPVPALPEITARLKAIDNYATRHPTNAVGTVIAAYRDYLGKAQSALSAEGPWRGQLRTTLNRPLLRDLEVVRMVDGRLYYLAPGAKWKAATVDGKPVAYTFDAITTADVGRPTEIRVKADQVAALRTPSALSALAKELVRRLDALSRDNWETIGLDLLQTVQQQRDVDPILRTILVDRIIKAGYEAGWGWGDALKTFSESLAALNMDDLPWMNPDDAQAYAGRPKAVELLIKLPDLAGVRTGATARRDEMLRQLDVRIIGRGVILRETGGWQLEAGSAAPGRYEVLALVSDSGGPPRVEKVGTTTDKSRVLDELKLAGIPEGSMVFLVQARQ